MSGQDNIAATLSLGLVDWRHARWQGDYYPEDLPVDWRLGYYANECGCVLLPVAAWPGVDADELEECVDDLPDSFRFYLQVGGAATELAGQLDTYAGFIGALLVDEFDPQLRPWRQLCKGSDGCWLDEAGDIRLMCWQLDELDMRPLRERMERLPATVEALIFDGRFDPRDLADVRALGEILGAI